MHQHHCLTKARAIVLSPSFTSVGTETMNRRTFHIPISESTELTGRIAIPAKATTLIIISGKTSDIKIRAKMAWVAEMIQQRGFATLQLDLFTFLEEKDDTRKLDPDLLTMRLAKATEWISHYPLTCNMNLVYLTTDVSTDFRAAIQSGNSIKALVSMGGILDLPTEQLLKLNVPALLMVPGLNLREKWINGIAFSRLNAKKEFLIIPGTANVFEGQGKLFAAVTIAISWLQAYLTNRSRPSRKKSVAELPARLLLHG